MDTETLISDYATTDKLEKQVNEEVREYPQVVSPSKETVEDHPKAEASPSPEAPSKSEEQQEAEKIEKTDDSLVVVEQVKLVEQGILSSLKETEDEKSEVEEVKATEQQTISPSKETEEEKSEVEEVKATELQTTPSKETEEEKSKVEQVKAIEQQTTSSPSKGTEEEKPKAAESQSLEAPSPETEMEDKQTNDSPAVDQEVKLVEHEAALTLVKETEEEKSNVEMEDKQTNDSPVVDQEVKMVEHEAALSLVKETEEEKSNVEEVKAFEQATISPSKETEEEKPKAAVSESLEAASPEVEEKMEDKQIEPSQIIKEVEKTDGAQVSDEEVKIIDQQETISPSKKTEKEEPMAGELPSPRAPLPKLEAEIVNEQIEPLPKIKEVEKIGDAPLSDGVKIVKLETVSPSKETIEEKSKAEKVRTVEPVIISPSQETEEEKPKVAEPQSPEAPSFKSEEKMGTQTENSSTIKEVGNAEYTPVLDVPVEDNSTVAKESFPDADISSALEPVAQPAVESVEEQAAVKFIEKQPGEKAKTVASPESSFESIKETEEPLEVSHVKESEGIVKEREDSGSGSVKVEKQEPEVPEMEERQIEEPEATEKLNTETEIKPEENMEIILAKDDETLADKVENTVFLKEEQTKKDQEPFPSATTGQQLLINQEAKADPTGDGGESSLPRVSGKEVMELEKIKEDEKKDVKTEYENEEHLITKELIQPETLKLADVSSSISNAEVTKKLHEGDNVKTEEDIKDNVISEISTQPKTKTVEEAGSSQTLATTEVTEKLFEGENNSREVEQFSEYRKEESLPSVQTAKDEKPTSGSPETEMEVKGESQETELELEQEEIAKANTDELEKEKEVGEASKSDAQLESDKDGVHKKTSQDQPKQDVSAKPAQKQSNTILSKVKQSLVKAKKAITGKSSRSTQRDIKVSSV